MASIRITKTETIDPRSDNVQVGSATYSRSVIVEPAATHKSTMIFLHGRGGSGQEMRDCLLEHPVTIPPSHHNARPQAASEEQIVTRNKILLAQLSLRVPVDQLLNLHETTTIAQHLPGTKFVFPTASIQRAKLWGRVRLSQWFDFGHFVDEGEDDDRTDMQVEGLRESVTYLFALVEQAIDELQEALHVSREQAAQRVMVGGLSMGCATSLIAYILWETDSSKPKLGAWIGFCGWLPFAKELRAVVEPLQSQQLDVGGDDVFESAAGVKVDAGTTPLQVAAEWLNQTLNFPAPIHRSQSSAALSKSIDEPIQDSQPSNTQQGSTTSDHEASHTTPESPLSPLFLAHGTLDYTVKIHYHHTAAEVISTLVQPSPASRPTTTTQSHASPELEIFETRTYSDLGHWFSADMLADTVRFLQRHGTACLPAH